MPRKRVSVHSVSFKPSYRAGPKVALKKNPFIGEFKRSASTKKIYFLKPKK